MSGGSVSSRRMWLGLVLVVLPTLALLGVAVYQAVTIVPELRQSQLLVAHSLRVITTTLDLDRAIQDAERGQRGFLITGDPSYLTPYHRGTQDAPALLSRLKQLTLDNQSQQARWRELEGDINTKFAELSRTIEVRQSQGFDAARQIVQTDIGAESMRAIGKIIDAADAEETDQLAQRLALENDAERRNAMSSLIYGALALLIVVFGAVVVLASSRTVVRSEMALRDSERRLRLMVSGARNYGFYMLDTDGHVIDWNRGAERLQGYAAEEIVGRHYSCFFTPEDLAVGLPDHQIETATEAGSARSEGWRLRKDGSRFWANISLTAIRDDNGTLRGFAKLTQDVTERMEAEASLKQANDALAEQIAARDVAVDALKREIAEREHAEALLRQAQKMEVLGQLTGGIAHDFNNMLAVIVANLETLQRRLPHDDPRLREPIAVALQGAERSAMLTHRLLAFSRRQPLEPRATDVNKLVSGMSSFIRRTLGESIEVEIVVAEELWTVMADINQLENAMLNLAVNARDAMPEGGKLTVETANVHLDEAYAAANAEVSPGQYVMLAISDTGCGMSKEVLEKAFEPFFTTKDVGQGTGLGLSQVYGFGKQSNGHIKIYSEPGQGTTVKLYMPRLMQAGVDAREERVLTPSRMADSPSATILVVEDNEFLGAAVIEILQEQGYCALLAPDGHTALEVLASRLDVELLFTDVGLPGGLNGRQLADAALQRKPGLRVLFTTGYTQNAIVHQGRLDPGVELIVKPFTYAALIAKIRHVLAKEDENA